MKVDGTVTTRKVEHSPLHLRGKKLLSAARVYPGQTPTFVRLEVLASLFFQRDASRTQMEKTQFGSRYRRSSHGRTLAGKSYFPRPCGFYSSEDI